MFDETTQIAPVNLPELKEKFIEAKRTAESLQAPMSGADDDLDARIAAVKEAWQRENAELLENYDAAATSLTAAETILRDACVAEYERTGEKTFDSDLSVRVNTRLEYDRAKATEWAKDNAPFILVADDKQFKNLDIAKTLDFVEEVKTVSAVISTKL